MFFTVNDDHILICEIPRKGVWHLWEGLPRALLCGSLQKQACKQVNMPVVLCCRTFKEHTPLFPGSGAPGQDNVADLDDPLKFSSYQRRHRMGSLRDVGNPWAFIPQCRESLGKEE